MRRASCCRGNDLLEFEFRKWTVAILCVRAPAALSVHDDTVQNPGSRLDRVSFTSSHP